MGSTRPACRDEAFKGFLYITESTKEVGEILLSPIGTYRCCGCTHPPPGCTTGPAACFPRLPSQEMLGRKMRNS